MDMVERILGDRGGKGGHGETRGISGHGGDADEWILGDRGGGWTRKDIDGWILRDRGE